MPKEHLIRLKLSSGDDIDFYRDHDKGGIRICDETAGICTDLPIGAQKSLELFAILESVGEIVEMEGDEDEEYTYEEEATDEQ